MLHFKCSISQKFSFNPSNVALRHNESSLVALRVLFETVRRLGLLCQYLTSLVYDFVFFSFVFTSNLSSHLFSQERFTVQLLSTSKLETQALRDKFKAENKWKKLDVHTEPVEAKE